MKWRPVLIVFLSLFLITLMVLSFVAGAGFGASEQVELKAKEKEESENDSIKNAVKFVQTSLVKNQSYLLDVNSLGRVNSSQSISVSSEVQGILISGSVKLKKGVSFKRGQVLFKVNNNDASLLLKARKSSYLTLLANSLPDIKIDFPEDYEVWKLFFDNVDMDRPIPPMPPIFESKLKTLLASRNILGEYYNIKADQVRLSKYYIVAPFNGTITDAFADIGSVVGPGTIVANIINSGSLEVECPVSPDEINLIKIGNEVRLSDDQNHMWTGVVSRKGQYLNPNTQSIPVFIQLNKDNDQLYNGMYLTAQITGDSIPNVYEVPRRALIANEAQVYLEQDSALVKRPVDIVAFKAETVLIGGLENGVNVVTEPLLNVKDKMKVASIAD